MFSRIDMGRIVAPSSPKGTLKSLQIPNEKACPLEKPAQGKEDLCLLL
jgi:hypothetical protein